MAGSVNVDASSNQAAVVNYVYRLSEIVKVLNAGLEPDAQEVQRLLSRMPAMGMATRELEPKYPQLRVIFERMQQQLQALLEAQS